MVSSLADVMLRHHVALQRLSADEITKVDGFLDQIAIELQRRLSGDELTQLARSRLERALERLSEYLAETLGSFQQDIMKDLASIADHEAAFNVQALNNLSVETDFTAPTALQIRTLAFDSPLLVQGPDGGKLLKSFVKGWTNTEKARVTNAIRLGVATGQTNSQIARGIRGTAALKYNDGLLAVSKRNADTIVHTAIQHVSQAGRTAVFTANDDIVEGERWISTLDVRTCPRCGALDQQVFPLGKGPRPALHPRCRCVTTPVFKEQFAFLQKGGTRPSVGDAGAKSVPAGTTFYNWLKTQPRSFVEFTLGPTRAKLLLDGELSASRFSQLQLDKRFMPMTLQEMVRLDPLAFDRAGVEVS